MNPSKSPVAAALDTLAAHGVTITQTLRGHDLKPAALVFDLLAADQNAIEAIDGFLSRPDPLFQEEWPGGPMRLRDDLAGRIRSGANPVRVLREARGLTQSRLAELAGSSAEYIGQIERGTREPSQKLAYMIARHLRVDVHVLDAANY